MKHRSKSCWHPGGKRAQAERTAHAKALRQECGWIQVMGGGNEVSSFPLQFNQIECTREPVGKLKMLPVYLRFKVQGLHTGSAFIETSSAPP